MRKAMLYMLLFGSPAVATAQTTRVELYELIKQLVTDSTGYENVGDWAVGKPKKYPVQWKADRVEMSADTSINFYRLGSTDITINGRSFTQVGQPVKWNVMLKGARSGYFSFSIISSPTTGLTPKYNLDSIFGKKSYTAKLLRSCDNKTLAGYYYYEVKIPRKDITYLKVSWVSLNGNTAIRIDCFDSWSKYAVKLDCPK